MINLLIPILIGVLCAFILVVLRLRLGRIRDGIKGLVVYTIAVALSCLFILLASGKPGIALFLLGLLSVMFLAFVSYRALIHALAIKQLGDADKAWVIHLSSWDLDRYILSERIVQRVIRARRRNRIGSEQQIEMLDKAVARFPQNVNALYIEAVVYSEAGHSESAKSVVKQALAIAPDDNRLKSLNAAL
jgi:tetratricopeptide (TPR) repeat protein